MLSRLVIVVVVKATPYVTTINSRKKVKPSVTAAVTKHDVCRMPYC